MKILVRVEEFGDTPDDYLEYTTTLIEPEGINDATIIARVRKALVLVRVRNTKRIYSKDALIISIPDLNKTITITKEN